MRHLLLSGFIFAQLTTLAQEDSTTKTLENVVVTGQLRPQSLRQSVYQLRVITAEDINRLSATKVQDVLNTQANFRFTQDVSTGGSGMTLNGVTGQNIKILLDGVPMIGRQGFNNEIGINQIDINSVERIEIIEGPTSVMYGADALAGVINIITKKAIRNKPFTGTVKLYEETIGNDYGLKNGIHNPSLSLNYHTGRWDIGGNGSYYYFGGWQGPAKGRALTWDKKDQRLGGLYAAYQGKNVRLKYRVDGLDEVITSPSNFATDLRSGDSLAALHKYFTKRIMQQLQADYVSGPRLLWHGQLSYTDYVRQVYSGLESAVSGDIYKDPIEGNQSRVDFNGLNFGLNAVYRINDKISLQPGIDINHESGEGERLAAGRHSVTDMAFYLSGEYQPFGKLQLRPGIRITHNSVYPAPPVVPALNAKYVINENIDIRASYARGFRAPSLRELYFNFFDVNHRILGNPELKAELSNSYNLSFNYTKTNDRGINYSTAITGFYNKIRNHIDFAVSAQSPDIFVMTNIFDSRTAGFGINTIARHKNWNMGVGGSYTGFFNAFYPQNHELKIFEWSPEVTFSAGYAFAKPQLDINFYYKYTGKKPGYLQNPDGFDPIKTDDYHWGDLTVNKKFMQSKLVFSVGAKNIFDVKQISNSGDVVSAHTSSNTINIGTGRSYFAAIKYSF